MNKSAVPLAWCTPLKPSSSLRQNYGRWVVRVSSRWLEFHHRTTENINSQLSKRLENRFEFVAESRRIGPNRKPARRRGTTSTAPPPTPEEMYERG